jgi:hypothetical protein
MAFKNLGVIYLQANKLTFVLMGEEVETSVVHLGYQYKLLSRNGNGTILFHQHLKVHIWKKKKVTLTIHFIHRQYIIIGQPGWVVVEPLKIGEHDRVPLRRMGQTQTVSKLVHCHGKEIDSC